LDQRRRAIRDQRVIDDLIDLRDRLTALGQQLAILAAILMDVAAAEPLREGYELIATVQPDEPISDA
jgi:hypothetical protein